MPITIGDHYTHYKRGGRYEIIQTGYLQSDTPDDGKDVIVYRQLHDSPDFPAGTVWVRTVDMFTDTVTTDDGTKHTRFVQID